MRKKPAKPAPPAPAENGVFFTVAELAERWGVHRQTVETAIRAGRLQAFKAGEHAWRIREAEVLRYEQQNVAVSS
jgi:excisionase family DNA binding protein